MTDDRLGIDALASAWLQFTGLADELPACLARDALLLSARITDTLSNLRTEVSDVIIQLDLGKFTTVNAARELRRALEEAAGKAS